MSPAADLALAVLLHLQRWPYDVVHGRRLPPLNLDTLDYQTRHLLAPGPGIHWQTILPDLTRHQLVEPYNGTFQLTAEGRRRGQAAHRRWMAQGFEDLIRRAACPAYDAFCRDTMDIAVGQLSPLDSVQLALLLSCAQGALAHENLRSDLSDDCPSGRLLDLGCGTGGVTTWLAQQSDAIAYGVDAAAASAGSAARRYGVDGCASAHANPHLHSRVQLHRADITALRLPERSFDVLVAVDVVSFLDHPVEVITDWLRLLAPGGRLVILGSEYPDVTEALDAATGDSGDGNSPPDASVAPSFVPYFSTATVSACWLDLSAVERRIYRRQRKVLPTLRERFEAEGQSVLHDLLWREARRYGHWADTGQSRRWLTVLRPV